MGTTRGKVTNKPTSIVVFGGTGDLAKTKLIPALLDLYVADQLPDRFNIIGFARQEFSDTEYQTFVKESIDAKGHHHEESHVRDFCAHIQYVAGNFDQLESYTHIKERLNAYDSSIAQCTNKLFYLAVPPQYYNVIFDHLAESQAMALCDNEDSWSRLLVEKPFGRDLATAQALEKKLCALFADEQIYRIDHYLAKDAIENLIALRFANSVLAESWNGNAIESIHIKLLETKDVSNRGSFYDAIGTLRDVGQNHLLQIFALLTMPPADVHDAQAIRSARTTALTALEKHTMTEAVRGQYEGYATTAGVAEGSDTETYFKLTFTLEHETWRGTKFTLEAGKALDRQVNEAVLTFRPHNVCQCGPSGDAREYRNTLVIRFAPKQHMCLSMWTKGSGFDFNLQEQELTLVSQETEALRSPEAYERVLRDCIAGDQTRFVSDKEVELTWQFVTPLLERFKELPLATYTPGTSGPEAC